MPVHCHTHRSKSTHETEGASSSSPDTLDNETSCGISPAECAAACGVQASRRRRRAVISAGYRARLLHHLPKSVAAPASGSACGKAAPRRSESCCAAGSPPRRTAKERWPSRCARASLRRVPIRDLPCIHATSFLLQTVVDVACLLRILAIAHEGSCDMPSSGIAAL